MREVAAIYIFLFLHFYIFCNVSEHDQLHVYFLELICICLTRTARAVVFTKNREHQISKSADGIGRVPVARSSVCHPTAPKTPTAVSQFKNAISCFSSLSSAQLADV